MKIIELALIAATLTAPALVYADDAQAKHDAKQAAHDAKAKAEQDKTDKVVTPPAAAGKNAPAKPAKDAPPPAPSPAPKK